MHTSVRRVAFLVVWIIETMPTITPQPQPPSSGMGCRSPTVAAKHVLSLQEIMRRWIWKPETRGLKRLRVCEANTQPPSGTHPMHHHPPPSWRLFAEALEPARPRFENLKKDTAIQGAGPRTLGVWECTRTKREAFRKQDFIMRTARKLRSIKRALKNQCFVRQATFSPGFGGHLPLPSTYGSSGNAVHAGSDFCVAVRRLSTPWRFSRWLNA